MVSRYEHSAKRGDTRRPEQGQQARFDSANDGGWTTERRFARAQSRDLPNTDAQAHAWHSGGPYGGAYTGGAPARQTHARQTPAWQQPASRLGRWTKWGMTVSFLGWLTFASSCSPLVSSLFVPRPSWDDALARAQSVLAQEEVRKAQENVGQQGNEAQATQIAYSTTRAFRPVVAEAEGSAALSSENSLPRFARVAGSVSSVPSAFNQAPSSADFILDNDREDVASLLDRARQDVTAAREGQAVKPIFFDALPYNLSDMSDIEARKQVFIAIVLPLALAVNADIQADRDRLLAMDYEGSIEMIGDPWLQAMAEKYYELDGSVESLLSKVAPIPVDMILAQAIEETGWGTSRFALKINALFGQRVWNDDADGLIPYQRDEDESFKVRGFESLRESIASYALNLNRHHKYADMRLQRQVIMEEQVQPSGMDLMAHMQAYSTERSKYIRNIKRLIKDNDLNDFNAAQLAVDQETWFVAFNLSSLDIIVAGSKAAAEAAKARAETSSGLAAAPEGLSPSA